MKKFSKVNESHKRRQRSAAGEAGVPLVVRVPVYAASVGLFGVYAWGYLNCGLGGLAWGLVGVTAMSEMIKPQLGELAAHALDADDKTAQWIVGIAAIVCVILGAAGGVVAMHVAEAPAARYAAAVQAVADAEAEVRNQQAGVDAVPTCAPEMPARRCERMIAENAPVRAERRARLEDAEASERTARASVAQMHATGPGLPHVELWHKALFVGGAEFLMFGVPFATLRLRRRSVPIVAKQSVRDSETKTSKANLKVNDGGWASRRAKYGPSGRRGAGGVHLHIVGA